MRPGTNTTIQSQLPPTTPPVNTGTWFVLGVCSQGPTTPQAATSFAQWAAIYGGRGSNPLLSDSVETYFNEGGSQVVTGRIVGPSAVNASIALLGAASAPSITVTALGPGAYANGYKVVVAGSGPYTITIEDSNSNILEVSNSLSTVADAVAYGQTSSYVTVTANGTVIPTAGTFSLTGGNDDVADITTTQYTNALALFTWDLGPGQVSAPGQTTTAIITAVVQHASASQGTQGSRVAYCDLPDSNVAATLTGDASPITALGITARRAGLFAPWLDIAPVTGTTGTRAVPPSAFAAGKACKNDAATGNPNQASAGVKFGVLSSPVNIHATFSDTDRQTLNTAGINLIRKMPQGYVIYGNVTAVNRNTDPLYYQLSNVRLDMAIEVEADAIQEEYVFSQIDGAGTDAADMGNELVNMLTGWLDLKALFVGKNGFAFTVDTTGDINTPITASEGELLGTIAYVRSPGAEQVNLNIVRGTAAQGV